MIDDLIEISIIAGKKILEIYNQENFELLIKEDKSPLTSADLASHNIIINGLKNINKRFNLEYPILSEESEGINYLERVNWDTYWLIDPLDGTKEFIKKNGEFTVNIALISNKVPVLGFVYAPVLDCIYYGELKLKQAFMINKVSISGHEKKDLSSKIFNADVINIIGSRSHMNSETKTVIDFFESKFKECNFLSSGSSLKLCRVAEGKADLYPRFAPTMEWDTAAADAICRAAGCGVYSVETNKPLEYNKENLLNPYFYVTANKEIKNIMESI